VRLTLTQKFMLGYLGVAFMAIWLPRALGYAGISSGLAYVLTWLVCITLGAFFSYQTTRTLQALHGCTHRIIKGDLTAEVDLDQKRRFPDEISDLACAVHGMLGKLRELVDLIQTGAQQVAGSTRELHESARAARSTNGNFGAIVERVAEGAQEQQRDIDRTQMRIRHITQAIRENSEAAQEAFSFVAEADRRASSGVEVSQLSVAKMQELFERVDRAGDLVFRFDQKIRSVHRITEMINSVSEKTHLLSLNASIEAARAGDGGRGFSVVAEEIRRLAESAANSGRQIEELVRQLEDESARVADVMRAMGQGFGAGRTDLDSIQASLEQVKNAVCEASQRAEVIFHQAEGSADGAEQVVCEFDGIAKVARGNVAATDDMRRGLGTQTRGIEEMVRNISRLFETADRLGEVAHRFMTGRT